MVQMKCEDSVQAIGSWDAVVFLPSALIVLDFGSQELASHLTHPLVASMEPRKIQLNQERCLEAALQVLPLELSAGLALHYQLPLPLSSALTSNSSYGAFLSQPGSHHFRPHSCLRLDKTVHATFRGLQLPHPMSMLSCIPNTLSRYRCIECSTGAFDHRPSRAFCRRSSHHSLLRLPSSDVSFLEAVHRSSSTLLMSVSAPVAPMPRKSSWKDHWQLSPLPVTQPMAFAVATQEELR